MMKMMFHGGERMNGDEWQANKGIAEEVGNDTDEVCQDLECVIRNGKPMGAGA